jgi:glycosyltransferase involved in cell wall biosynthesis
MMPLTLSVIVCTHNPRWDFLQRTLEALRTQRLPASAWELLLVDNASDVPLAGRFDVSWHPEGRIVLEPETGLTAARLCGIFHARAPILVFVDDDNLLAPDYLQVTATLATAWPMLGVWGCGSFVPEWESAPPAHFAPYLAYLAVQARTADRWSNRAFDYDAMPAGAGICLRRDVAARFAEAVRADPRRRLLGRQGNQLSACEDFDLALTAIDLGLGTGVFVNLRLTHLMPAVRTTESYLLRLVEGHARSTVLLFHLRGRAVEPPPRWLGQLRRWRFRSSLSPVERRIYDARSRGEASARAFISSLPPSPSRGATIVAGRA